MSTATVRLRVVSVRSINPHGFGGCIFSGREIDEQGDILDAKVLYVVVAPFNVIKDVEIKVGQWWSVAGSVSDMEVRQENGFVRKEKQIKAIAATMLRVSGEHIIDFLANTCTGIGHVKARRLWDTYQDDLYKILDNARVQELASILTHPAALKLIAEWDNHGMSSTLQWLQTSGIDVRLGRKIIDYYKVDASAQPDGDVDLVVHRGRAEEKIKEDPYRLLSFSVPWKTVDALAQNTFGVKPDDPRRLQGAIEEALYRLFGNGHTAAKMSHLETMVAPLLADGMAAAERKRLVFDSLDSGIDNGSYVIGRYDLIHPVGPLIMETEVANAIATRLSAGPRSLLKTEDVEAIIKRYETVLPFPLSAEQRNAIRLGNEHAFAVIVGGAGTGKTTVLDAVYEIYDEAGITIHQMALAGKAAQRMHQATKRDAVTIASFLNKINGDNDGEAEIDLSKPAVVVIDESSMLDIMTMYRLMRVLPDHVRVVLTGDSAQLMPVGPGLVLHEVITVPEIPLVTLTSVKRYGGMIAQAANLVRNGEWMDLGNNPDDPISFIVCDRSKIADTIVTLYDRDRANTQILSARRSGTDGVKSLNFVCQSRYTKSEPVLMVWNNEFEQNVSTGFHLHDPVICTVNRWDVGVLNGSVGRIVSIEDAPKPIYKGERPLGHAIANIEWDDGKTRPLLIERLDDIELAYAMTIHKSQGSQWSNVIVALTRNRLLDRTLVYTAMTRTRSKVILVGDADAVRAAVVAAPKYASRQVALGRLVADRCGPAQPLMALPGGA